MALNRTYWLCFTALAGVSLLVPSHGVLAQDSGQAEDLGVIEVVGNYNGDPFAEDADRNAAIYITEEAIRNAENGDLRDLFAEEASVTIGGGIPVAQKIYVNGVDMVNLNVTIDGTMQNNRAFHHVTANAIDPGLLKAVRVDAGVAAADSGPNAIAGSVAFETKDALDLLKDSEDVGAHVMLSAESNGATFSESLTAYGRHEGFDFLGYVKNSMGDDYKTGGGWTIDGTGADYQSYLAKLGYSTDVGGRFEASAQMLRDDAMRPSRANFGLLTRDPDTVIYDTTRQSYSFNYLMEDGDGYWDPEVVLGYSSTTIDKPEPYDSLGEYDTLNGKLANTFHFSDRYRLTVGGDFYRKTSIYSGPGENYSEKSSNIGGFAQARLEPIERLNLSFGMRFDGQQLEGVNEQDVNVSGASGNASASYELFDGVKVKAGYSNVFGGISLEDNYQFWRFTNAGDYDDLKASRSENLTAGFEIDKMNFTLSGEVFKTNVKDARTYVANTDFSTEGFDVGVGYRWDGGRVKFSYSNVKLKEDGDDVDTYSGLYLGTPIGETISASIQHRFDPYGIILGGNVDAALPLTNKGAYSEKDFEGYAVVNAFVEYEPEQVEGLSLRLDVKNLFDEDYADRSTYGGDFETGFKAQNEPGRSFFATVRYEF